MAQNDIRECEHWVTGIPDRLSKVYSRQFIAS
ncbi:hypothetical protein VCSRO108_1453 [Vibrio cholerae]|nr:hypothetical protein VCSRO108_1453 [Vibrio cholerae]